MTLDLRQLTGRVRVADGAWGTELQKLGLQPGAVPELWNEQNRQAVLSVAQSYVRAGSEIILTNTFGANRFVLAAHGLAGRAAELAEAGAAISRQAAGARGQDYLPNISRQPLPSPLVFGSVGPSGKIVMMGDVSEEELELAFAETATALTHGGADAIVLETFNELDELEIALRAVKQVTQLPVVASMTFASGPDKTSTMMGNTPADLARLAEELHADAVGANCGLGPDNYIRVCQMLESATDLPIWIKANAGLPTVSADGKTTFPMGPQEFARFAPLLAQAGANFIGGCCGTTPEHIRAVRQALEG